jgi:hypothetical protein
VFHYQEIPQLGFALSIVQQSKYHVVVPAHRAFRDEGREVISLMKMRRESKRAIWTRSGLLDASMVPIWSSKTWRLIDGETREKDTRSADRSRETLSLIRRGFELEGHSIRPFGTKVPQGMRPL